MGHNNCYFTPYPDRKDILAAHNYLLNLRLHYIDVIISAMAPQITSPTIFNSSVYSRRRSKKTSKLRVAGLCEGNSAVTGEFPAQRASNAENVSIWWRHHVSPSDWHTWTLKCFRSPFMKWRSAKFVGWHQEIAVYTPKWTPQWYGSKLRTDWTRTTKTPAFCGYLCPLMITHTIDSY